MSKKKLPAEETKKLISTLNARFKKNMNRHKGIDWAEVEKKLIASPAKLWTLNEMEFSGGEPDVVGFDKKTGQFIFYDCSPETPKGRRSLCYDDKALESRKEHKPSGSAMGLADEMGVDILSEAEYMELQKLGEFDLKTSSWIKTPDEIRKLGGAVFGDRRFGRVFFYHNGAESYYGSRAFRGSVKV